MRSKNFQKSFERFKIHDDEQTNPPTPMCHVQYRIALSKQCSAANRVSGLEKIELEFLQNYKVEVTPVGIN